MSELVVIGFDTPHEADRVLTELARMRKEYLIDLEDAVVAIRDPDGNVRIKQSINLVGIGAAQGGLSGALWGSLVGLLFLNPLIGFAVGGAIGAGSGALSGGARTASVRVGGSSYDDAVVPLLTDRQACTAAAQFALDRRYDEVAFTVGATDAQPGGTNMQPEGTTTVTVRVGSIG